MTVCGRKMGLFYSLLWLKAMSNMALRCLLLLLGFALALFLVGDTMKDGR